MVKHKSFKLGKRVQVPTGVLKKKKDNQRRTARKKLVSLLKKRGSKCHWCGINLVHFGTIKKKYKILSKDNNCVVWENDGETHIARWATVDHLKELLTKDANKLKYLVVACHECNNLRSNVKMSWNYRVMKHKEKNSLHETNKNLPEYNEYYAIHEVYYDVEGISWTVKPICLISENVDELKADIQRILKAFEEPILEYKPGNNQL